jgi:hypothetical protein
MDSDEAGLVAHHMNANQSHPLALDDPRFRLVDDRTRPEFMLIGGAKCGSTSFAMYLSAHPQVETPCPATWRAGMRKEPNYWSWRRFPDVYQNLFVNESPILNPGPSQYVSGEYSTSSLIHPLVPRRVQANLPGLKIFVLLRNPVDRAYSHFMMFKRTGLENECSFEEIVRREMDEVPELLAAHERGFLSISGDPQAYYSTTDGKPIRVAIHKKGLPERILQNELDLRNFYVQSYVFRSLYHDQLHRWLRMFPRRQLMIISSENFFKHEADTMNNVADFLGLDPFEFETTGQIRHNWKAGASKDFEVSQPYAAMDDSMRKTLTGFFEPYNQQLYQLIDEDLGWD